MARSKDIPCTVCGVLGWKGPGVVAERYVCQPCRRIRAGRAPDERLPKYVASHEKSCALCGATYTWSRARNRYCSTTCSQSARSGVDLRECVICSASFRWSPRKNSAGKCCSRECGFELMRYERKPTCRVVWQVCVKCSQPHTTRGGRKCGCPTGYVRLTGQALTAICQACEDTVNYVCIGSGSKPQFCGSCRAERDRASTRRAKAVRRARLRGAIVEHFDHVEIFERDRWKCRLCNKRVKRTAPVPHPLAPTLDHVVPLSKGGDHTRAVRPLHLQLTQMCRRLTTVSTRRVTQG